MISLSISFLLKKNMSRRFTEVLILCMAWLGQWVATIVALAVSGLILFYSSAWDVTSSSGLDNCQICCSERSIPSWPIDSMLHLSLQRSLSTLPTAGPCLQWRCRITVWALKNRGHSYQNTITVDVDSPCLTILVPSVVWRIGMEYLGDLVFEGKGNKEGKNK